MKTVRTFIIDLASDSKPVLDKISSLDWIEETRIAGEKRIIAVASDTSLAGLKDKEKNIKKITGIKSCMVFSTQYMPEVGQSHSSKAGKRKSKK